MTEHPLTSSPASGTRAQLVDAAERVLRSKGLARATTKEIAREAGCAEGTLYLHFADKLDLVRAVHEKLLPAFVEVVRHLPGRAGTRTVEANLTELAHSALRLYRDMDARDEEPVVVYHSHTATEAYPSRTDTGLAMEPNAHYVLVSTREHGNSDGPVEFRSYRIVDGQVTEEEVSVVATTEQLRSQD